MKRKRTRKKKQAVRVLDQRHRREQQRLWASRIAIVVLCLSVLIWCWVKLTSPQTLPIQQVSIEGEYQHLDKHLLKQAILPYMRSNFFTVNMNGIRERLAQFAWCSSVFVWREWPNHLHVELTEQVPDAIWREAGLLNTNGELFTVDKTSYPANLPLLVGPAGQHYRVWQEFKYMANNISPLHLKIVKLEMTDRNSWIVQLDNGVTLWLGQDEIHKRLQRFAQAYPKLKSHNATPIDYVDLRYNYGMAVKYKGLAENKKI